MLHKVMPLSREIIEAPIGTRFGELLRQAHERSGLTQQQFADRLGVQQPRISEIFGSASITEALFDRCADALGVAIEVRLVK